MTQEAAGETGTSVMPWDPIQQLKSTNASSAKYSRGFLRSKPEKWFPGFAAQWMPLIHALGLEIKITEVKPLLEVPESLEIGFGVEVEGEQAAILFDRPSGKIVSDALCPAALQTPRDVVLEYCARRLLNSLAASWSGAETSQIFFDSRIDPFRVPCAGAIRLSAVLNGQQISVWILLGRKLVDKLDGLWRRQTQSSMKAIEGGGELFLEIAQLAVPPSMLVEYTRTGTVIDLEVLATDSVVVRSLTKPHFSAKLHNLGGNFGLETIPGPPQIAALPDGTTRLSIAFGKLQMDPASFAEIAQPGVVWDSGIPIKSTVEMVINGEKVAEAALCVYEGRFAISVN